jgi:hypothetical protein
MPSLQIGCVMPIMTAMHTFLNLKATPAWASLLMIVLIAVSGCSLSNTATEAPTALTVEFIYPANNLSIVEGTDLQIQLAARAPDGKGVARIELRVDGELVRTAVPVEAAAVPVFVAEMNWLTAGIGLHALEAVAYDADGSTSTPKLLRINVIAST